MGLLDIRSPTSLRLAEAAVSDSYDGLSTASSPFMVFTAEAHDSHPPMGHLIMLVFGAVLEVVCVALPGYVIARLGHFDAEKQKFLANLNVMLFTPCLIFVKLASQLNADKLAELGIIPIIFIIQTAVSFVVSRVVSKCFGFNKRAANFVTAMGVFGNSNSLPISLVISLAETLKGLHWDRIPGDTDDEVAARGILYLMIFQQLGQLVRWSWGYHVLLAPKDKYEEYNNHSIEEGRFQGESYRDEEQERLIEGLDARNDDENDSPEHSENSEVYEPAGRTPVVGSSEGSPHESEDERDNLVKRNVKPYQASAGADGIERDDIDDSDLAGVEGVLSFPRIGNTDEPEAPSGFKGLPMRMKQQSRKIKAKTSAFLSDYGNRVYNALPQPFQRLLSGLNRMGQKIVNFLWEFMNPPLWAMLIAIFVASVPELQDLFFEDETFVKSSITDAISSSAGVAVPLILVVLGANLARNTQKRGDEMDPEEKEIGKKLLVASLICRMLLPTLIMAPILALFAKYVPVSILDDPIFIVVCFLLTGAPSALQLAQICQINQVYEGVMGNILFQSYVIWILPSTLMLVMCALEVLEWAK